MAGGERPDTKHYGEVTPLRPLRETAFIVVPGCRCIGLPDPANTRMAARRTNMCTAAFAPPTRKEQHVVVILLQILTQWLAFPERDMPLNDRELKHPRVIRQEN
jgi:hypothetical protein